MVCSAGPAFIVPDEAKSPANVKFCEARLEPLTFPLGAPSYRCETKGNHHRNPGGVADGGQRRILAGLWAGRVLAAQLPADFRRFEAGQFDEPDRALRLQSGLVQLQD